MAVADVQLPDASKRRTGKAMTTEAPAMEVREAALGDLDAIVDLHQPVQSFHAVLYPGDFRAVAPAAELRAFFEDKLLGQGSRLAIARLAGRTAGYAWFEMQDLPETPFSPRRRRVYVHQLAVAPDCRRKRVATALMAFIDQAGFDADARDIVLDCWVDDGDGEAFLQKNGFAAFKTTMCRRLASR
jgi:ribosomal protein S18 acetylase RimI-like enzyme